MHRGGRLVSSQPEPEWDEQEQGWMLALRLYRQGCCPACDGNLELTTAPENEGRYKPMPAIQCFRCVGFSMSHKAHESEPHPLSLIHLVPRGPA